MLQGVLNTPRAESDLDARSLEAQLRERVSGEVRHVLFRRPAAVGRADLREAGVASVQDDGKRIELRCQPGSRGSRDAHLDTAFAAAGPDSSVRSWEGRRGRIQKTPA